MGMRADDPLQAIAVAGNSGDLPNRRQKQIGLLPFGGQRGEKLQHPRRARDCKGECIVSRR